MAKKKKFYVVWEGIEPGIYDNWLDCKRQIDGYQGAKYKSFNSSKEAAEAYRGNYWDYVVKKISSNNKAKKIDYSNMAYRPIEGSICVDAACSGNPGNMEYRAVDFDTGFELFKRGPYHNGTNNIGEFLAIVHCLAHINKNDIKANAIYTDSKTAMSWVKHKTIKTKLVKDKSNEKLFDLMSKAMNWLKTNDYNIDILKWETELWGEIPADFGRK